LIGHIWRTRWGWEEIGIGVAAFVVGALIPIATTCLLLWHAGVFEQFWFWTINYAQQYGTRLSLTDAGSFLDHQLPTICGPEWPVWIAAVIGLGFCYFNRRLRPNLPFLALWALFSIAAVCAGFYFRQHYFIMLLPAI